FRAHACLKLVLAQQPANISFCMCHMMDHEDPAGVALFLKYGADPNLLIERGAGEIRGLRPLHFAILRNRSPGVARILLQGGADPRLPSGAGFTPYAFALVLGRRGIAAELRRHGGATELSPKEQFLAACSAGRNADAKRLLRVNPALATTLSAREQALLPMAAGEGRLPAVKTMLALGFPIDAPGAWGGTAIHQAAWAGHIEGVRYLMKQGASLTCRQCFGGDVLQTAKHGMAHARHTNGPAIVQMLTRALRRRKRRKS
ncbi:MAG TPA: ankyrin repeat domain-containing protein, partial [Phycisphaerae bacterium]|nr:ankyrin repeat domain-containing protein [Phycisphaerae bacterium]